jgi:methionyl-tRNA synthetase
MDKFYVTTPIYYVNDEPHIGHAYTTILADVLAGYHRIFGRDVFFLTGTDEHGQKLQDAAKKYDRQPQEYCDEMVVRFKNVWKKLGIRNDEFIRTTESRHKVIVQKILQQIYDKGEIYSDDYEGWYCVHEERFWTEKDLVDGNCPDCNRPVSKITEKNYFFKMSKYQDWLIDYIKGHPDFILPEFRRNEVLGFLKQPLEDLCISRPKSRLSWGIELPFDKDYVCYVWFDALINYISAVGYLSDDKKFKRWWPAIHLIGKDILTTHAVYWPCMLEAMGVEQPKTIFAHGWWLTGETKMSKSRGNVIKPLELADKYGVDAFRYFLIREMTLGQDATYTEEAFISRYNSDLANDLGNLLSRIVKMVDSYCGCRIPKLSPLEYLDSDLMATANVLNSRVEEHITDFRLNSAVEEIMSFVRSNNRYLEQNRPWDLHKNGEEKQLSKVLFNAANSLVHAAYLLEPIIPEKSSEIFRRLGYAIEVHKADKKREVLDTFPKLIPGKKIKPGKALFPRLQKADSESRLKSDIIGTKMEQTKEGGTISFDEFNKMQLKTATVIDAEKVEGTDKLLKLQIDLGDEKRQIVAGIAQYYTAEDMIGKRLVIVCNLKPARIRGIESNGMLLAAQSGKDLVLLTTDKDIPPGAGVS